MSSLPLLLLCLLLLPDSLIAHSCCDEPSRGCFPVRCEDDCSYKPCQHAPCNGDSIGQMWCVNKEGERITDIGWSTCGSRFATYKDCADRVKAWEAANGQKTGAWMSFTATAAEKQIKGVGKGWKIETNGKLFSSTKCEVSCFLINPCELGIYLETVSRNKTLLQMSLCQSCEMSQIWQINLCKFFGGLG